MNKKFWPIIAATAVFGLFSCSDDLSDIKVETSKKDSALDVADVNPASEKLMVKEMTVEFDDATAVALCKENDVLSSDVFKKIYVPTKASAIAAMPIETMTRVFPDAGEWEERHREAGLHRFFKITYAKPVDAEEATEVLNALPAVTNAEIAVPIKLCAGIPFNDTYAKSYQWQYYNDGSMVKGFVKGCDINVVPVWEQYTGGKSNVIVSVVDEGIDMSHPDLKAITLPGGANGSRDFCGNTYTITAGDHGSHVGGIVAGINNNGTGICGVAGGLDGKGGVTLMSCQIFKGNSGGDSGNAIVWGADHGAVISQNSWGYNYDFNQNGKIDSNEEYYAKNASISSSDKAGVDYFIKYAGCDKSGNQLADAPMKGGVVIFAAGNDNFYNGAPANYAPVIAVGAIGPDAKRAAYSNYGDWVDICAPGGEADRFSSNKAYILSCGTVSGGSYVFMCGTSMACPMVSGVAALLVSQFGGQGFTNTQLRALLEDSENRTIISPSDQIAGLVDAYAAFQLGMKNLEPNDAPSISTEYKGDYKTVAGTNLVIEYTATDPNDDVCTFSISGDGSATVASSGTNKCNVTIVATAANVGTHKATLTASDGRGCTASVDINYTILKNEAPAIELVGTFNPLVQVGGTATANFKVTDKEGDKVTVTLATDPCAKLTKNSDESYSVAISGLEQYVGKRSVVLTATDAVGGKGTYELNYEIFMSHAPVITPQGQFDPMIPTGSNVTMDYKVTDYDGDKVTVTLDTDGSAVLSSKGNDVYTIAFQAKMNYVGSHTATIRAKDATGLETTLQVAYQIYINYPPVISTTYAGDYKSFVGKPALVIPFTVTDANNDAVTVTLSGDNSSTLAKVSEGNYNLTIRNTAANAGQHTVTINATDGKGGDASKDVTYTIINNHAPTIKAQGSIEGDVAVGQKVSLDYDVADQDGDVLDVQLSSDGSATLTKKSEGVYTLSINDEERYVGNHTSTITVTDPYGEKATASLSYKIYVNQAPKVDFRYSGETTLKWFEVGSARVTATDPEGKSGMTFTVTSNNAVSNPTKVSDGEYTFAVGDKKFTGTCTVTATATDWLGAKTVKEFTYTVLENRAPELKKQFKDIIFKETSSKTSLDLANYFSDPDGEALTFTCDAQGDAVAVVTSGSDVNFRAVKNGFITVKVSAKDGYGAVTEATFRVGVFNEENGPAIGPNPVKDYLTIRTGTEKSVEFSLYAEGTGKLVMETSGKASVFEPMVVDMRNVASGRYKAKVVIGGELYERDIVKL